MKQFAFLFMACSLFVLPACGADEAPSDIAASDSTAVPISDALTGTWVGDWGPSATHRNPVTLDLKWDGTNLSGTVNPGPNEVGLTKAAFVPDTGAVTMEAEAAKSGGQTVRFVIEGKVAGNVMEGTWIHDDKKGDFKITKS
jgi:hypothetical protein